jgi:hypothetical protein
MMNRSGQKMSLTNSTQHLILLTSATNGDKMIITIEQVELWLGSDCTRTEIIEILVELANGDYDQQVLRTDIVNTCEQHQ